MPVSEKRLRALVHTPEDGYTALALTVFGAHGRPDWHAQAACRHSSEQWSGRAATNNADYLRRHYCGPCPVRDQCLNDQLAWERTFCQGADFFDGFVGGYTAPQRRAMLRPPKTKGATTGSDDQADVA